MEASYYTVGEEYMFMHTIYSKPSKLPEGIEEGLTEFIEDDGLTEAPDLSGENNPGLTELPDGYKKKLSKKKAEKAKCIKYGHYIYEAGKVIKIDFDKLYVLFPSIKGGCLLYKIHTNEVKYFQRVVDLIEEKGQAI